VAEEHQVLLLTCHPHVVELVERVTPAVTVVELARTSPVAATPPAAPRKRRRSRLSLPSKGELPSTSGPVSPTGLE
jgi:hypothetical protein